MVKSYTVVFLAGNFLFTSSDIFAVGCIDMSRLTFLGAHGWITPEPKHWVTSQTPRPNKLGAYGWEIES